MKKILAMALSVAIIATIAISGTVAYLNDQATAVNQAQVGTVFVEQYEKVRDGNSLADFVDGKLVVPAVTPSASPATSPVPVENTTVNMPIDIKNFNDKIIYAKNTGNNPAYMRTVIAVPKDSYDNWLHLEYNEYDETSNPNGWKLDTNITKGVTIEGQPGEYDLIVLTSDQTVESGAYSTPSLLGFYIDSDVNNVKGADGTLSHYVDKAGKDIGNISDLRIIVATQAVQKEGFDTATDAFTAAYGAMSTTNHPWKLASDITPSTTHIPGTAADLKETLSSLNNPSGNHTIFLEAHKIYDLTGIDWTPITVSGSLVGGITIDGCGATIKGLNAPLFFGGSQDDDDGIIIKNLTIADSEMTNTKTYNKDFDRNLTTIGFGAFVAYLEESVTLENCHLKNVTIDGKNAKTGGLIGYTTDYFKAARTVTVKNCTVEDCTISANASVGGIIGHAGGSLNSNNVITGCTVKNTTLTSTDESYRVGAIVGTAHLGKVTITGCTSDKNTIKQYDSNNEGSTLSRPEEQSDLYGRFVPGETGKLTINGTEISNS